MKFILGILLTATLLMSCQFKETMVMDENGQGRMSVQVDLAEMMAFGGGFGADSTMAKQDTIIAFKDFLVEKRDSIATLPVADQERLKALENYNLRMFIDPETEEMLMDLYIDFDDISDANDIFRGFEQVSSLIPGNAVNIGGDDSKNDEQVIGVRYEFKKNIFKRDSYIIDEVAHQTQMDSIGAVEAFLSGVEYTLEYTFPRKIKSTSIEDATFSLDGKTIEVRRKFIDYMKNPDVLDLEVKLEN
jgi:hypothetical protein